jgi:hypothetical protein
MVVENSGGCTYRAEAIIAERVAAKTTIRFQCESLETGYILIDSDSNADVHHPSEFVKQP